MKAVVEIELVKVFGKLVDEEIEDGRSDVWEAAILDDIIAGLKHQDSLFPPSTVRYAGRVKFLRWRD